MIKDCWAIHRISGRSKELGLEKKQEPREGWLLKTWPGFHHLRCQPHWIYSASSVPTYNSQSSLDPVSPREPKSLMIASDQWNLHPLLYLSGLLAFTSDIESGALSPRESCPPYFWTRYPGVGFSGSSTEQYCSSRRWSWARWGWVMWGSCSKEGHILYLWMITLNFCRTEKIKVYIKHGTGHDGKMMAQQVPPSLTFYC